MEFWLEFFVSIIGIEFLVGGMGGMVGVMVGYFLDIVRI